MCIDKVDNCSAKTNLKPSESCRTAYSLENAPFWTSSWLRFPEAGMLLEDGLAFSTWLGKLIVWLSLTIYKSHHKEPVSEGTLFVYSSPNGWPSPWELVLQQHFESYICTVHLNLVQFLQCSVVSPLTQHLVSNLSSCLMEAFQGIQQVQQSLSPKPTSDRSCLSKRRAAARAAVRSWKPDMSSQYLAATTLSKNHMKHMKLRLAKEYPNTPQPREAPKAMAPIPRATFPTLLQALENWPHKQLASFWDKISSRISAH